MRNANDDDEMPFQSLAAVTARILETGKPENNDAKRDSEEERRRKRDTHHEYVDYYLREIERFEERSRGGGYKRPSKRSV